MTDFKADETALQVMANTFATYRDLMKISLNAFTGPANLDPDDFSYHAGALPEQYATAWRGTLNAGRAFIESLDAISQGFQELVEG